MQRRIAELGQAAAQRTDPEKGLRAVTALRAELDRLEADHVERAVRAGYSWRRVADALGTSKQAAHKRHARRVAARRADAERPEAPRVTIEGHARQAVEYAREEARTLGDEAVGTAHLLLGIMREGHTAAARTLRGFGISLSEARRNAQATLIRPPQAGEAARRANGRTVLSAVAHAALSQAVTEARERGDGHLGTEHLLLAILRDGEGGAARTLAGLGLDADRVIARLLETAGHSSPTAA